MERHNRALSVMNRYNLICDAFRANGIILSVKQITDYVVSVTGIEVKPSRIRYVLDDSKYSDSFIKECSSDGEVRYRQYFLNPTNTAPSGAGLQ